MCQGVSQQRQTIMKRASWLVLLAVSCVACHSGSSSAPPASVAGTWIIDPMNSAVATFRNCNGALVAIDGLTWDAVGALSGGRALVPVVTQSGDIWSMQPQTLGGINWTGGGTVNGNDLTGRGRFDGAEPVANFSFTILIDGVVNGNSITLSNHTFRVGLGGSGQCKVSPPLNMNVTVQ